MSFFGNFFWKKKPKKSKYLTEKREPIEISFVKKFTLNGGKFLYCENEEELKINFQNILIENEISTSELFSNENSLTDYFKISTKIIDAKALLINCEFLISDQGSIMVSSNQILNKKLNQLPKILIILAKTSDFKQDVSDAMSAIKNKYSKSIPSNITNIYPTNPKKNSNFISYKRTSKELYLLVRDVNK
ncbi:MAG: LUD domain-containing protein [Flavobacteriaceae bacterium]